VKRIFVPTRSGIDWQILLAKPTLNWKRGASAMTTAICWEAAAGALPPEIAALLDSSRLNGLENLQLIAAFPEWETELEGGITTSKTDILAICRNGRGLCVLAIEAKVDEDFGPLVEDKQKDASPGQLVRLKYLKTLLGIAELSGAIRYQLLHRMASALVTARLFHAKTAVMLVQSFGHKATLHPDFRRFGETMNAREVSAGMYSIPGTETPNLFLAWCKGDPKFLKVGLPRTIRPSIGEIGERMTL
jgi:hypothetical protein